MPFSVLCNAGYHIINERDRGRRRGRHLLHFIIALNRNQKKRNPFAIAKLKITFLQSLFCKRFAIALRWIFKRNVFALQSFYNRFAIALQSPCNRLAIALQSLCNNRFAIIALQSLCNRFTIALQSLCNRFAIALQSLCICLAIVLHLPCYRLVIALQSLSVKLIERIISLSLMVSGKTDCTLTDYTGNSSFRNVTTKHYHLAKTLKTTFLKIWGP
jgi:hypothetical protein